jgi:hypothetical protein
METPINWQGEARKMRAQGKSSDEIAAQLGKARSTVIEALRGTPRPPPAAGDARSLGAGRAEDTVAHVTRTPRTILDRQALPSAAADFAAGRISRDELMKKITR